MNTSSPMVIHLWTEAMRLRSLSMKVEQQIGFLTIRVVEVIERKVPTIVVTATIETYPAVTGFAVTLFHMHEYISFSLNSQVFHGHLDPIAVVVVPSFVSSLSLAPRDRPASITLPPLFTLWRIERHDHSFACFSSTSGPLSRTRMMQPWLAQVNAETGTPVNATIVMLAATAIIAFSTNLSILSNLLSISTLFIFMLVALALLVRRYYVSGMTTSADRTKLILRILVILGSSIATAAI
ncbi:hypothetical protein GH714_017251 [Hevea brasiliensis]|uniref:Uncharacterized protein n=1 Tax=Hevea brasiliensis TaxID=3981 RepID=A0A6A6MAQ1_HEVBR|nr:hypothetical protein GH714_017251 [Hevea brasiliensis]